MFLGFFACLPNPSWWELNSLGGYDGDFILEQLKNISRVAISLMSLTLGLITISIITEISFKDWIYFLRYSFVTIKILVEKSYQFIKERSVIQIPEFSLRKRKIIGDEVVLEEVEDEIEEEEEEETKKF